MKLFNRKPELTEDEVFTKLDKLMSEMASTDIYIEYLEQREGMQELQSPRPFFPICQAFKM